MSNKALNIIDNILYQLTVENAINEQLKNLRIDCINCELRFIKDSDGEQMVKVANSKQVSKYLRDRFPYPYTLNHAKWWINYNKKLLNTYIQTIKQQAENIEDDKKDNSNNYCEIESFTMQIVDKENDIIIGGIGVDRDKFEPHKAELGYWLNENYWNKGITSNAVKGFIDFIWNDKTEKYQNFNHLLTLSKLVRIETFIATENIFSVKVVEKCGFKQEGLHRKGHKFRDGTLGDQYTHAIIKTDFTQ